MYPIVITFHNVAFSSFFKSLLSLEGWSPVPLEAWFSAPGASLGSSFSASLGASLTTLFLGIGNSAGGPCSSYKKISISGHNADLAATEVMTGIIPGFKIDLPNPDPVPDASPSTI